jgi:hypothetical protein
MALLMASLGLNEGIRVFSYALSGLEDSSVDASGFPFVDSGGNRISCNYAKINIHYDNKNDANAHLFSFIQPSSLQTSLTENSIKDNNFLASEFTNADVVAGNLSGMLGGIVITDPGEQAAVEFKCANSELMDSVLIRFQEDYSTKGTIFLVLTYGNITPFNTLRQDRYDRGV